MISALRSTVASGILASYGRPTRTQSRSTLPHNCHIRLDKKTVNTFLVF
jgi:hypothetical protein